MMSDSISREEHRDLQRRVERVEATQAEDRRLHIELAEGQGRIEEGIRGLTELTNRIVESIQRDVQNLAEKHREDVAEINDRITRHTQERDVEIARMDDAVVDVKKEIGAVKDEFSRTVNRFLTWIIVGIGVPILGLIGEQIFLHVFK